MTGIASRSELRMSFLRYALFTVPAVLLLGMLSGYLSNSGYGNAWFDALRKPSFMPPGWVFGTAWTILYILLGLSLAMLLHARGAAKRERALVIFGLGLLLNTSFLGLRRYLRQRNLQMPTEMAATWLGVGVTLILVVLAVVGSYSLDQTMVDVYIMLAAGFLGYVMRRFGFSPVPVAMGLLLGGLAENSLKQALLIFDRQWWLFGTRPIAMLLFGLTAAALVAPPLIMRLRGRRSVPDEAFEDD